MANLNSPSRLAILACFAAVLSYLVAKAGGTLVLQPQMISPLWLGNVLLVAVLLMTPSRIWPLLMISTFATFVVYDLQAGVSVRSVIWLIVADAVEVLTAAACLRYFFSGIPRLNSVKALARFLFIAVVVAPFVGAFLGALGAGGNYWMTWGISFFSEALGYLMLLPAVLGWMSRKSPWRRRLSFKVEAIALVSSLLVLGYLVFIISPQTTPPALLYSFVPFLLWSALRFGTTGVSTSAILLAFLSIWAAVHGNGPFNGLEPLHNIVALQLFLFFAVTPFMFLAALVEERESGEEELRENERRFRLVANTAPVMIWMSAPDKLCTFFNNGWLEFTGQTMEHELGEGWASGVHPDDLSRFLETYSAAFDARAVFEMEYRLRRFDGKYRWITDSGVPRLDLDGTFRGYIGSCIDITERKLTEASLEELSGRLINAQEEERTRIARELHDDFSQRLALHGVGLGQLWHSLPMSDVTGRERVREMLRRIQEMSSDMHSLSHQLHSSRLEHVGLGSALEGLCREMRSKHQIAIEFTASEVFCRIPKDVALCLFRIAQEALGNVVKHSQSKKAQAELEGTNDGLCLRVTDAGIGFDPDVFTPAQGIGLISMRERLRLVHGTLSIRSGPMQGTEILAQVPLPAMANETHSKMQTTGA